MLQYVLRREAPPQTWSELASFFPRHLGPTAQGDDSTELSFLKKTVGSSTMFGTIRRYEAIDQNRTNELVKKAEDTLLPRLSELPGFNGYYLIEAGNGVISSVGFFDTAAHAEQSTGVAAEWVREQKLET